ncbi:MAG: hypothetical protein ACTHOK_13165 [Nocardioidaceae bacterium]
MATIAGVGLVCALVVRLTLPASRNFVGAPARLDVLVRMSRRALDDRGLLALYGVGACSMGAFVARSAPPSPAGSPTAWAVVPSCRRAAC